MTRGPYASKCAAYDPTLRYRDPEPGYGYRWVACDEFLQKGDEYFMDFGGSIEWREVTLFIGEVCPVAMMYRRREFGNNAKPQNRQKKRIRCGPK